MMLEFEPDEKLIIWQSKLAGGPDTHGPPTYDGSLPV
jgi:hypothetical protein